MKKTKLKERLDKAVAAFWDESEKSESEFEITYVEESAFLKEERSSRVNFGKIFSILKQILLFLPGTFFTFYMWMGTGTFGLPKRDIPLFLTFLIISSFLTVLGIGKIRNPKHWLIPLSVGMVGLLIGLIPNILPFTKEFFFQFENVILFFPLALITAVLSKNLIDSLSEEKTD